MKYPIPYLLVLSLLLLSGCGERKVIVVNKAPHEKTHSALPHPEAIFNPSGWETAPLEAEGDPKAIKGGSLTLSIPDFPPTFRTLGKDTALMIISLMEGLIYEPLLAMDPKTLKYKPGLASYWKISPDKSTYWFRINPLAKWSDGAPVTSEDVVATFRLMTDKGIQDPGLTGLFSENYETPVALDAFTVSVRCKKKDWRSFMYFSTVSILPASHLSKIDGASYLEKYQYRMLPGTGPYILDLDKTVKGNRIGLKRRDDYWADSFPSSKGLYNFDEIKFLIVTDDRLEFEKFKKGETDLYIPSRAGWWHEEMTPEKMDGIKRGLLLKKKVYNFNPLGMSGLAFNTLEEPFVDIRVRQAFSMLWNVDQLIAKMFFGEYERCKSYFQGTVYENPRNPLQTYDPAGALKLLASAGWKREGDSPWLSKKGQILEIDFKLPPELNRIFTPFQQDLKNAGIKLNLINMTDQAVFENVMKKKFKITYMGWTGSLFPNPEGIMHSKYAAIPDTSNITGFRNPKIDKLCEEYNGCFDVERRIQILRELDGIAVNESNYAFGWVAPYAARVIFWNKFGFPEEGLTYSGDYRAIPSVWWVDPEKEKQLSKAIKNRKMKLPRENEIVDFWKRMNKP